MFVILQVLEKGGTIQVRSWMNLPAWGGRTAGFTHSCPHFLQSQFCTAIPLIPFPFLVFPALGSLENFVRCPISNRSGKWSCNWEFRLLVTVSRRKQPKN